jgi:hypothetical protein
MGVLKEPVRPVATKYLHEPAFINHQTYFQPAYVSSCDTSGMNVGCPPGLSLENACSPAEKCVDSLQQMLQPAFLSEFPCATSCRQSEINVPEIGSLLKAAAASLPDMQENTLHQWPTSRSGGSSATEWSQMQQQGGTRKHMRSRKRMCVLRIASHLNELEKEDPNKILILRRINRLGFNSGDILKQHYERYGPVSKVLLSNAHARQEGTPYPVRLRPSGIGYILFERAEDAACALAEGETHVVAGVEIFARGFQGKQPSEEYNDAEGNDVSEGNSGGRDDADHDFAATVNEHQRCKAAP